MLPTDISNMDPISGISVSRRQSNGSVSSISETGNESVENNNKLIKSKKDLLVIISMAIVCFVGLCGYSLMAPFFPLVSKEKGTSTFITGFIFAVYPLSIFLLSPIVGKYMPLIGPKLCLITGAFVEGASHIVFGFVDHLPDGNIFIGICFTIRVVTAIGTACADTAFLSIMLITFKENSSTVFGMVELFSGLGAMAGPAIGGVLFKVGGFNAPFIAVGSLLIATSLLNVFILPGEKELTCEIAETKENQVNSCDTKVVASISEILRVPGVFMMFLVSVKAGMVLSYLNPILTTRLEVLTNNKFTSEKIGLFFFIAPALYSICAPPLGYLTDKMIDGRKAIIVGHFVVSLTFFFIGPSQLVEDYIKPSLWLTGVSLALLGIGIAPFVVPCIAEMKTAALNAGFPDSLGVTSILSGLFGSGFSVGEVIGPTLGGLLTDHTNFRIATSIFSLILLFEGASLIIFTIWERNSKWVKTTEHSESTKPLLADSSNW